MMATEWFNRRPGDVAAIGRDDPTMLLLGGDVPDWVKVPPEAGGGTAKVLASFKAPCPMCKEGGDVRHLKLEGNLGVAECTEHGFVWYRFPV
jgi:hypothetical protein